MPVPPVAAHGLLISVCQVGVIPPTENRVRILCLTALIVLAGCGFIRDVQLTPEVSRANAQMAAAKIDCDAKFPPAPGHYLAHSRCVDAAQNWVLRPLMPYPDLLNLQQSNREALAARVDRGDLDPGEFARLSGPEDAQLTLAAATLKGPLTRWIPPAYYAPPAYPFSARCTPEYGFTDCRQ